MLKRIDNMCLKKKIKYNQKHAVSNMKHQFSFSLHSCMVFAASFDFVHISNT